MNQSFELKSGSSSSCIFSMMGLTVLVVFLEALTLWAWGHAYIHAWMGLLIHVSLCFSYFWLSHWYRRLGKNCQLAEIAYPIVLFLGPIGAIGMFLTSLLYTWYRKKATPFEIWYREILPEQKTSPKERLIERLMVWDEETELHHQEPIPFTDVLASGERSEKQSAISLMQRNFHPSFAPAFHESLSDPDSAIRVQAASAITRIEEDYLAENLVLERRRATHPTDKDNLTKLAKHYDEHALAGLSDEEALNEHRQKAEQAYQQLHDLQPDDAILLWSWGRLLVRSDKLTEAAEIFEKALSLTGNVTDDIQRVWYWECLYDQSRYTELREQIKDCYEQISRDSVLPQALLDSIDLWMIDDIQRELVPLDD